MDCSGGGGGVPPAQAFVDEALSKCTLYELLNKTEGFLTLQHYFISAALMLDRDGGLPLGGAGDHQAGQPFLGGTGGCFDPVSSSIAYFDMANGGLGGLTD